MEERIIVPHGTRAHLKTVFGRSLPFIRKALLGVSDHPDAARIRMAAMENGGIKVEEKKSVKLFA
jgi:hypothetical protein